MWVKLLNDLARVRGARLPSTWAQVATGSRRWDNDEIDGGMSEVHSGMRRPRLWTPQARTGPPVGPAFVGFVTVGVIGMALVLLPDGTLFDLSQNMALVSQLGVVAATIFLITTLLCFYRGLVSASRVAVVLAVALYGPSAVWAWTIFVGGTVPGTATLRWLLLISALVSVVLLARGLAEAHWIEVFGGLAGTDLVFALRALTDGESAGSLLLVVSLVAVGGMTGLYGLLVDIELTAHRSLGEAHESNASLVDENERNREILHDVRSGLLSIEAALAAGFDVSGPVSDEAARLRRLTNGEAEHQTFDLVAAVRALAASREASGLALALSVPSRVEVSADESEVLAIVENLVANAHRHGQPPVRIEIEIVDGNVEVGVTDNGEGIEESLRDSIFDRGFSTDPAGTGLGLARARALAEKNNGRLLLDVSRPKETRFVLSLSAAEKPTGPTGRLDKPDSGEVEAILGT